MCVLLFIGYRNNEDQIRVGLLVGERNDEVQSGSGSNPKGVCLMVEESDLTAYCGLYCGDCVRYKNKASDLAQKLVAELQNSDWNKWAEVTKDPVFCNYNKFLEVLNAIAARQCEKPCRTGGGCSTFKCEIIECCNKNNFEGCWQCQEFETCIKFEFLRPGCGETPRNNIRKIKNLGLNNWVEHRHKFYVWQ